MKGNKMFAGLIAGAALGTVAGLLIAPKPGRESRQIVTARAGELRHKTGDYMDVMRSWKKSKKNDPVMASNGHANGAI